MNAAFPPWSLVTYDFLRTKSYQFPGCLEVLRRLCRTASYRNNPCKRLSDRVLSRKWLVALDLLGIGGFESLPLRQFDFARIAGQEKGGYQNGYPDAPDFLKISARALQEKSHVQSVALCSLQRFPQI